MMFMFTERTAVFLFFITLPYYVRNYSQHRLYHDRQHGRQCSQACHQASISKCIVSCHGIGSLSFGNQCRYFTFAGSNYPVLFIVSLALGTLVGTLLDKPASSIVSYSISLNPNWQKDSQQVFYYIVLEPCRWSDLS